MEEGSGFIFESENFKIREVCKLWVPFVPNSEGEHRFLAFQSPYLPTRRNHKQGIRTKRVRHHTHSRANPFSAGSLRRHLLLKRIELMDFPGGPVVKISSSSAAGVGLIPFQGTKIPHALQPKKSKNIKQKQYCNKFNKDFKNGPYQKKILKKKPSFECELSLVTYFFKIIN